MRVYRRCYNRITLHAIYSGLWIYCVRPQNEIWLVSAVNVYLYRLVIACFLGIAATAGLQLILFRRHWIGENVYVLLINFVGFEETHV